MNTTTKTMTATFAPAAMVDPLSIPWHVADAAVRRAKAVGRSAPKFYVQVIEAWKHENARLGALEDAKRAAANAPRPMTAEDFVPKSVRGRRANGTGRNVGTGLSRLSRRAN